MGCNPVSMVDPLGLRAGLAPGTKLQNFMPPNAGIAYVEGQRVVLGGAMKFNFDGDFVSHQAFYSRWVNEQAGEYEKAGESKSGVQGAGEDASGHNFSTEDKTLEGKDRISLFSGNLKLYISQKDDGTKGIHVFAIYTGDVSGYDKTEWIQIAKTNAPLDGKSYDIWLNDYNKDEKNGGKYSNGPFYYNKSSEIRAWRKDMASKYGGVTFQDNPYRNGGNSFYWQGQLSLVGLRNGSWETIQTVNYGFTSKGMQIDYTSPIILNAPDPVRSSFYQTTLILINLFKR